MTRHQVHGGALDDVMRLFPNAPQPWIDLSTGINPWPYPLSMSENQSFERLPTATAAARCRSAMATYFNTDERHILLAPGSELLIRLLPTIMSPNRIVVLSPTYGDHASVWKRSGRTVIETDDPFHQSADADVVVVCNPNNPDGRRFDPDTLLAAHETLAKKGGWLIVDEAYADLDPSLSLASFAGRDGLIILRSFGKFFGLAGLRLGAMLAPPSLLSAMNERLGFWPVSGPALEVGTMAYRDENWQREMRIRLREARITLDDTLAATGLAVAGGTDLFRYVRCADAAMLWNALGSSGIYTRKFMWSNQHLRLGLPRNPEALTRLENALTPLTK